MRSSTGLFVGAAALAVGYFLYRKASAAGHLVFSPGNVVSMDFVGTTPTITFELIVQNTSNADLDLFMRWYIVMLHLFCDRSCTSRFYGSGT